LTDQPREIDVATAARMLEKGPYNFLRRGADLSLRMSNARWRLMDQTPQALVFRPVDETGATDPAAESMSLDIPRIERVTWDRLPRQRQRSQVRLHLADGELWTFSGVIDESLLSD
jgi:hypothetical protein